MRSSLLALAIALAPAVALPTQYAKTAIVSTSGGDYLTPNAAVNDLATWCGTPSATNRCLIKIMPGVYTLTPWLVLRAYLDVEGSGANVTVLQGTPNDYYGSMNCSSGGPIEARGFTVESSNGKPALQCTSTGANLRVVDATFRSSGSQWGDYAVDVAGAGVTVELDRVTVTIAGPGGNGIEVTSSATARIVRSTVVATCDSTPSPQSTCIGVLSGLNATTEVVDSSIQVSGAVGGNVGAEQYGAGTLSLSNVSIDASLTKSTAVVNNPASNGTYGTLRVEGSRLKALGSVSIGGVGAPAGYIATTRLDGTLPQVYGGGSLTCVGAYTGAFKPLASNCQLVP